MTAVTSQPVRGSRFPTLEKYDVLEELGHGGMATVYRARDLRLGRDVAIKVIHPHLRDSAEAVRRFSIEARAVAKLRHTNIVEVYDISAATESEQYLVVELLRGVTLRRLLETHGSLPPEVAAAIAVELLAALGHAHEEGVVHRDVKPENVILEHRGAPKSVPKDDGSGQSASPPAQAGVTNLPPTPVPSGSFAAAPSRPSDTPGDRITIKLTDFGIAKLLDAQGVTSTGQVLGSPAHMAPEQIEGREVDGRADVFAMGVLLYECMVGHLPFQGQNPAQVLRRVLEGEYPKAEHEKATVGRTWSVILDRALANSVDGRFPSALEMRDALMRELARLGVASPRGEVEAWLDDPAAYALTHAAAMPGRLCARGDEASRRRDVLGAAADYNRALAYAPNDAALMKLVLRVNRRNARRTVVRRVWPYAGAAVFLVAAGFGARAWIKRMTPHHEVAVETTMVPPPVTPVDPAVVAPGPVVPEVSEPVRTLARPAVSSRPKATTRDLVIPTTEPAHGVYVSVDANAKVLVEPGKAIPLDVKPHSLKFTCESDLCEPLVKNLEAGDRLVSVPVRLTVKPCMLSVRGVPGHDYGLNGLTDRGHHLSADEPNPVPMQSMRSIQRVVELDTGRALRVELLAGKVAVVDFTAAP